MGDTHADPSLCRCSSPPRRSRRVRANDHDHRLGDQATPSEPRAFADRCGGYGDRWTCSGSSHPRGWLLRDERRGRYWQLNGTGALVVQALVDGATPEQGAERLAATRPVTPERATADVRALVARLVKEKLVIDS